MYIGEVSKNTGLSIRAIRFYEEKGLIKSPKRRGKYRVYEKSDIEILQLIKEATVLGISLSRLNGVIVYKDGEVDWKKIHDFLTDVKSELLLTIDELKGKVTNIDQCRSQIKL